MRFPRVLDILKKQNEIIVQQPNTEIEKMVSEIWCEVLGLPFVGINDNFFDLGGTSLSIIRVHDALSDNSIRDSDSYIIPISNRSFISRIY